MKIFVIVIFYFESFIIFILYYYINIMATSEQLMETAFGPDDDEEIIEFIQNSDIITEYLKKVFEHIGKGGVELENIELFSDFQLFITSIKRELQKKKMLIILTLSLIATSKPGKEGELAYILQKTLDYNFNLYIAYKALLQTMNKLLVMLKKNITPMEQAEEVVGGGLQNGGQPGNFFSFGIQIFFGLMLISFYLTLASAQPTSQEFAEEKVVTMNGNGDVSVNGQPLERTKPGGVTSVSANVESGVFMHQTEGVSKSNVNMNKVSVMAPNPQQQVSYPEMYFPGFAEFRGCYEKGLFGPVKVFDDNGKVTSVKKAYESENLKYDELCPSGASPYMKEQAAKFVESINSFKEEQESSKEDESSNKNSVVAKFTPEGFMMSFAVPGGSPIVEMKNVPELGFSGSCYDQLTVQRYIGNLTGYDDLLTVARKNAINQLSTMTGHLNKQKFMDLIKGLNYKKWPSKTSMPRKGYKKSIGSWDETEEDWAERISTASELTTGRLQEMSDFDFDDIFKPKFDYAMKQVPVAKILFVDKKWDHIVKSDDGTKQETIKCHSVNILIGSTLPDIPALMKYKTFMQGIKTSILRGDLSGFEGPEREDIKGYEVMVDNVLLVIGMAMDIDKTLTGEFMPSVNSMLDTILQLTQLYNEISKIAADPTYTIKQAAETRNKISSVSLEGYRESNKRGEALTREARLALEQGNAIQMLHGESAFALDMAQDNLARRTRVQNNWFTGKIKDIEALLDVAGWRVVIICFKIVAGILALKIGLPLLKLTGELTGNRIRRAIVGLDRRLDNGEANNNPAIPANPEIQNGQPVQNPANNQQGQLALDDIVPGQGHLALDDIVNPNQAQGLGDMNLDYNFDEGAVGDVHNALGPQLGQQNQNPFGGRRSRQTKKLMRYRKTRRTGNKTRKNKKQKKQTKKRRRQIKNKKNTRRN
jgi:hypothetical protein